MQVIPKGIANDCFKLGNARNGGIVMADIKFEIEKQLGSIAESAKGWKKELNLISWNGKDAKYDLRDWDSEHKKMGKGITLTTEELKALKELLNSIDI